MKANSEIFLGEEDIIATNTRLHPEGTQAAWGEPNLQYRCGNRRPNIHALRASQQRIETAKSKGATHTIAIAHSKSAKVHAKILKKKKRESERRYVTRNSMGCRCGIYMARAFLFVYFVLFFFPFFSFI